MVGYLPKTLWFAWLMDYIRLQWFERVWPETREQLQSCAYVIVGGRLEKRESFGRRLIKRTKT